MTKGTSPKQLDAMRDAFLSIMEELDKEGPAPSFISIDGSTVSEWQIFGGGTGVRFFRRPESKKAIGKFERHFSNSRWANKWSSQHISAIRGAALSNCMANPEPAGVRHWLEEAARELDQEAPVHRVIFAVSGVAAATPLAFGPVSVFQMTENEAAWIGDSFAKIIERMRDSVERKEDNLGKTRTAIAQLTGSACIEVKVCGDTKKAVDDAPILAEPVIDFLMRSRDQSRQMLLRLKTAVSPFQGYRQMACAGDCTMAFGGKSKLRAAWMAEVIGT